MSSLGPSHLCSQMIENLVETLDESSSVQFLESSSMLQLQRVDLPARVILEVDKEERDLSRFRILIVCRKLGQEQSLLSVVLQIVDENSEELFHDGVEPFRLFVGLRVVERRECYLHSQSLA